MTEIKISCLDECLYMRKCDGDENEQGVKMAISSNDVQLILLCGCLAPLFSFHEKFIFSYSFLWWSRKIQIFHSRHLMMVLIISYYLHYQMSQWVKRQKKLISKLIKIWQIFNESISRHNWHNETTVDWGNDGIDTKNPSSHLIHYRH